MSQAYVIDPLFPNNRSDLARLDQIYAESGISRDPGLDYIAILRDYQGQIIGGGGLCGSSLRSLAVLPEYQGEGLLAQVAGHLMQIGQSKGIRCLYVYTKVSTADLFQSLGFHEIARVQNELVFMESRKSEFEGYLGSLKSEAGTWQSGEESDQTCALVMNLNPLTRGHYYLIESALARFGHLHLFLVSEERSVFSYSERRKLLEESFAGRPGLRIHATGPYLVSSNTFPSYFLRDQDRKTEIQARLDAEIFLKIAEQLGITARLLGSEPFSPQTNIYNQVLTEVLNRAGIRCEIVERLPGASGEAISASGVRRLMAAGQIEAAAELCPPATAHFLRREGESLVERIKHFSPPGSIFSEPAEVREQLERDRAKY